MRHLSLCVLVVSSGCAGYSITHNGTGDGYDVYRPEPYILVVRGSDGDGQPTLAASIVWLPDYGTRYRVDTWNCLAKGDFTFKIADGWQLTEISDKSDATDLPGKLIELATKAAEGASRVVGPPGSESCIELYRIAYGRAGVPVALTRVKEEADARHRPPLPGDSSLPPPHPTGDE
ncbi:MAG: hypothetical protein JXP34_16145 [Planctomycetes bacterium]|nr:hypothetical protein [Planctomycetota bacterium]